MAKILITGGSGFIGTNLVELHRKKGDEILNLDWQPVRNPEHESHWTNLDVLDREKFVEAVRNFQPDVFYHLAARTDIDGKTLDEYKTNTDGVRNAVLAAKTCENLQRFVVASSQLVCRVGYYPKDEFDYAPPNAYGESKVMTEKIVREEAEGLPWVLIRPTTIWGDWFGVKYQGLYRTVRRNRYIHPKGMKINKVWGYVGNSVFCLEKLASAEESKVKGKVFFLADYEAYDLLDYAKRIEKAWGAAPIKEVPLFLLRSIAKFGDLMKAMGRNFPLHSYRLSNFLAQMQADLKPLEEVCGPLPYTLDQSVANTVAWIKAHEDFDRD